MTWVFWCAAFIVAYAYVGYAAWLWIRKCLHPRPTRPSQYIVPISVVLVVCNEAAVIERKLRNLLGLNYPADRMEIIVVSDGSSDETNKILSRFSGLPRMKVIMKEQPRGKSAGLNAAIDAANGEIIVFTDVRQTIEDDAVRLLLENFADAEVGCVSGELMLGDPNTGESVRGMGLYWKIEKTVRMMESVTGSTVGATGAFYAVRRGLVVPLPLEIILDDVYIPMHVVRQGARVALDRRARAWDSGDLGAEREFSRKVRTLSGNYQLLHLEPWLLGSANPIWFRFVSHKLTRLLVPFALVAMFATSLFLPGPIYRTVFVLQLAIYGLSGWAMLWPGRGPLARIADAALTFVFLNTAAVVAFAHFVSRRRVYWQRPAV